MKSTSIFAGIVLAVAAATAGCDSRAADSSAGVESSAAPALRMADPTTALLRRVQKAPWTTAYSGTRRIDQTWKVDNGVYSTSYTESVAADGQAHFAIDVVDLIAPQVSPVEQATFATMQKAREGFLYRFRDFHVHDVPRFTRYYTAVATGKKLTVAGRSCAELIVQRRVNAPWVYELAIDDETGLILSCRQELSDGTVVSSMEFETIDFMPNLSQTVWHASSNDEEALLLGTRAQSQLGFTPRLPVDDGQYFTLIASNKVTSADPNGGANLVWAKHTLSDGVEVVFFLDGGPDASAPDVMRIAPPVGPWSHVEGTLHGERLMAMGRVSVDELLDLLQSAF